MNDIGLPQIAVSKNRNSAPEKTTGQNGSDQSESTTKAERPLAQQAEPVKAEEEQEVSVQEAVARLNDYVQKTERRLEFQLDDDSGETVVRVYDKNSAELIRQIPNQEALQLAQRLNQEEPLLLFSAQV